MYASRLLLALNLVGKVCIVRTCKLCKIPTYKALNNVVMEHFFFTHKGILIEATLRGYDTYSSHRLLREKATIYKLTLMHSKRATLNMLF